MKLHKLCGFLCATFLLCALTSIQGCGGGGGGGGSTTPAKAAVTLVSAGNGQYLIQGSNMDGVAGIQLAISYDSSALSSPIVTPGSLISGRLSATNVNTPGAVRMDFVGTTPISGNGLIATISFTTGPTQGSVTLDSVLLVDVNGTTIQ